jgi:hypothetical protein
MQIPQLFGDLRPKQNVYLHVRNADSTTLLRGAPAVYNMNGTNDGIDVVQAATAGANKSTAYFAGVVQRDIAADEYGMALIHGVADFVRCSGSVAVETSLSVNPAAANFVGGATVATIIAVTSVGPAVMPALVNAVATATVDGVSNVSARVFVRAM